MAKRERTTVPGVYRYAPKVGDPTFYVVWRDRQGKQHEEACDTFTKARSHKRTIDAMKDRGAGVDTRITFGEWWERWWPAKQPEISRKTADQYESLARVHVLPAFGSRRLADLRQIDVRQFLGALKGKGLKPASRAAAKKLVHQVLQSAVESQVIGLNAAAGVKVEGSGPTTKKALTAEQIEALAAAVPEAYRVLVLVLGYAGLRPGEAAALQRQDFDGKRLHVHAVLGEVGKGAVERRECTKTYQPRHVPLDGTVLEELDRHVLSTVPWAPTAPIFTAPGGGPVRTSILRRTVKDAARRAGLPSWVTPYSLRHTCASLLMSRNLAAEKAAKIMGHNPSVFSETYAHPYDEDLDAAAAILGRVRDEVLAPVVELHARRAGGAS